MEAVTLGFEATLKYLDKPFHSKAREFVYKGSPRILGVEDFEQEARLACWRAWGRATDPEVDDKEQLRITLGFLYMRGVGGMLDAARCARWSNRANPENDMRSEFIVDHGTKVLDHGSHERESERMPDTRTPEEYFQWRQALTLLVENCRDPKHYLTVLDGMLAEKELKDIAGDIGVSQPRVSQIKAEIYKIFRSIL